MRLIYGCLSLVLLLTFVGCASTPVRHLAADVILLKPGVSTKQDVLMYLGEPDGTRQVSPGISEFVYHEEKRNWLSQVPLSYSLSRMPKLDFLKGDEGYEMVVITLADDIVNEVQFKTFNPADHAWVDDFTWQEIK